MTDTPDQPTPQPDLSGHLSKILDAVDEKFNKFKEESDRQINELKQSHEQQITEKNSVIDSILDWIEGEKVSKEKAARSGKKNQLIVPPQDLSIPNPEKQQPNPTPAPTPAAPTPAAPSSSGLRDKIRRLV